MRATQSRWVSGHASRVLMAVVVGVLCIVADAAPLRAETAPPAAEDRVLTPKDTTLPDSVLDDRLRFLKERLDDSRTHGQIWYWSWMTIDSVSMVWLGVLAGVDDKTDNQVNNAVNAGMSAIGIADLLLRPLEARHGAGPIEGCPMKRAKKNRQAACRRKLLHGNAERADERTSFATHAGNVGLNAVAGLIIGLVGRPSDAIITFASGTAGGVINILSAPWRPARDWKDYQAMVHDSGKQQPGGVDLGIAPMVGGAHLVFRVSW
ncbi:MAG: hypothetical protein HWD60_10310 [Defluviicoccus sp.]|nr:MAG: hypothetical protein HWD60_10310 [Defluviicoccus sp.]